MTHKRIHLLLGAAGYLATVALLYGPLPGFWSSAAWGQQSPTQLNPSGASRTEKTRSCCPAAPGRTISTESNAHRSTCSQSRIGSRERAGILR